MTLSRQNRRMGKVSFGEGRRGITLIELSVALAIVAILFGAATIGLGALTGAQAKETTVELAGAIRTLYDVAALSGKTCRLVFQLPGEREPDGKIVVRAECAKMAVTARSNREDELHSANEKLDREKKESGKEKSSSSSSSSTTDAQMSVAELMAREKERIEHDTAFSSYTDEQMPPKTLSGSISIAVWTSHQKKEVKHGIAYLYFFPRGYTERAQIAVSQGDNVWTLKVAALTGKVTIVSDAVEIPST